jgi:hypothetical protein
MTPAPSPFWSEAALLPLSRNSPSRELIQARSAIENASVVSFDFAGAPSFAVSAKGGGLDYTRAQNLTWHPQCSLPELCGSRL